MSFWSKIGLADASVVQDLRNEIDALKNENQKLHDEKAECIVKNQEILIKELNAKLNRVSQEQTYEYQDILKQTEIVAQKVVDTNQNINNKVDEFWSKTEAYNVNNKTEIIALKDMISKGQAEGVTLNGIVLKKLTQNCLEREQQEKHILELIDRVFDKTVNLEMCGKGLLESFSSFNEKFSQTQRSINSILEEQKKISEIYTEVIKVHQSLQSISGDTSRICSMNENYQKEIGSMMLCLKKTDDEMARSLTDMEHKLEDLSTIKSYMDSLWESMKLVWINDLLNEIQ